MKRLFLVTAMLLSALALAGAPPAAQAAPALQAAGACDGGEGVYLYDLPVYQGDCIKITGDVPNLDAYGFNDRASSVRIVGNWITSLFADSDYRGSSSFFTEEEPDFRDNEIGDNRASSIGARRGTAATVCDGGEGVYLYDQRDYRGRCVKLTDSYPDLSVEGFNNLAASIRIVGGWTAALYVDQSYGGALSVFTQSDPDLRDDAVGEGRASSIGVSRSGAPQQNACDGGEGVYLYEHPNYEGRCVKFTEDEPDLRSLDFDDTASSIRFLGNWAATLYRDLSSTGAASTFTRDDPNLAGDTIGDNQATSISVRAEGAASTVNTCDGREGVYLFEHPAYQGRCIKLTADILDLRVLDFDDIASSIRVVGDWTVTLYRDLDGTGAASAFMRDDTNLNDDPIGDNQATSVLVQRGSLSGVNVCDGAEGVYLYEHPDYQGRCVKLTGDAPDLRGLNFDDLTSSVAVVGNWTVTLYRDLNGTGASSTFTSSDPNVIDNPIGDNQATSARVRRR
jgi:hypothetical protein